MRRSWIFSRFRSYLGDPIYHTPGARYNDAIRWYRTLMNLGFPKTENIVRLARFIRYGVLSSSEASAVFYGRLPVDKSNRYSLMIYWIEYKWIDEGHFYYKDVDLWQNLDAVESITLFP